MTFRLRLTPLLLLPALWMAGCRDSAREPSASLSVAGALRAADDRGYARALEPRPFSFPADHGPHPDFRTEWWYFTGNLATPEGRRFGFQLTFFRSALAPRMEPRGSAWATRQAWLAHFTVSDVSSGRFHSFERWSRGAVGLAGIETAPFRVWVEDWSAAADPGRQVFPLRLQAAQGDVALDLRLSQGKPPVLQGERGLSRKSSAPGNASFYYSLTRMPAEGTVRVGPETFAVEGAAWMDREWSTSSLGTGQVGWDWFALQLDDGTDLMLYQLRHAGGGSRASYPDPASSGSIVPPDGASRTLSFGTFSLAALDHWQSPRSGARYPARWRVRVPSEDLDLTVTPLLADQELDVSFRYWEGAVAVEGTRRGAQVSGRGYVELTGYAEGAGATR